MMLKRAIQQGRKKSPSTEAYPCGTSQGAGRLRTPLVARFSIILEEPLATEEEGSRHPRVGDAQTDAPLALIDVILLIKQIDDVESQ